MLNEAKIASVSERDFRAASGERRAASGERRAASGERRAASGERRAASGERRAARRSPLAARKSRSLTLAIFASFSTDFRAKERLLAV